MKIKMLKTVRAELGSLMVGKPGTILRAGVIYAAESNQHGAVSGICGNGEKLGVKPGEFEFINAPEWVLNKWRESGLI